jgi:hypothetical protein
MANAATILSLLAVIAISLEMTGTAAVLARGASVFASGSRRLTA